MGSSCHRESAPLRMSVEQRIMRRYGGKGGQRGRHIVFVSKTAYGRATVPLFSSQVCELSAMISVHVPKS